jgi:hypothetical protein
MLVRATKALFWVSDLVAWTLLVFTALAALAYPASGPIYARMAGQPLSAWQIAGMSLTLATIAIGAFLLTRRRISGFILVLIPSVFWLSTGSYAMALIYFASVLAIFGTPFVLAYCDLRARQTDGQET